MNKMRFIFRASNDFYTSISFDEPIISSTGFSDRDIKVSVSESAATGKEVRPEMELSLNREIAQEMYDQLGRWLSPGKKT